MTDWAVEAQRRAEEHLAACEEALHDELPESPATAPYCGCDTCMVREVLAAAWEALQEGVKAETRDMLAEHVAGTVRDALRHDHSHRAVIECARAAVLTGPPVDGVASAA